MINREKYLGVLFTILSIWVIFSTGVYAQDEVVKSSGKYVVSPEKFRADIDSKKNIIIIDVRTPEEFADFHIDGAINIDYRNEDFRDEVDKLNKHKKYYIYCRTGRRSASSQKIMNDLGFKKVYDLDGGIKAWQEDGFPVKSPDKD